jgi:hypothetical protein
MSLTRREMLERSMFATAAALLARDRAGAAEPAGADPGPNGKVRVAVCGVKGRGGNHIDELMKQKDVEIVALVDVDPRVIAEHVKKIEAKYGRAPRYEKDLRKLLEDKSVDGVSIATTDHTHALLSIWAMQAGKHVYVEKPISHSLFEGRQMVAAARKYKRVCQAGHQCRSSKGLIELMPFLHGGGIGKVTMARGLCYKRRGSIGKKADENPPAGVDYDLWLGPAPYRSFNPNRFHYNWHWFWDYGASDMTAQGVHQMDVARWGLNKNEHPKRVQCVGGRLGYVDDGEVPNTQVAWYDYGDCELVFETRGLDTDAFRADPADKAENKSARIGVIFYCENGYVVNPSYTGAVAFDKDGKVVKSFGGGGDHFRNFIDGVKAGSSDKLACEIEQGHLSVSLCHLGQISCRLGAKQPLAKDAPFEAKAGNEAFDRMRAHLVAEKLNPGETQILAGPCLAFDPKTEKFTGNDAANKDLLMKREYRKPFVVPDEV